MRYTAALSVFAFIGLSSCHSFNHYEITAVDPRTGAVQTGKPPLAEESLNDDALEADLAASGTDFQETTSATMEHVCPVYHLPKLPPVPELPYDQLDKMANDPSHPYDKMAQAHITQLHNYIVQIKGIILKSHEDYLLKCAGYLAASHQNSTMR